jgi:hypothetical protein
MVNGIKLTGTDLVAIVAICICGLLIYAGHNSVIVSLLATIVGWYFGRRMPEMRCPYGEEEEEKKEEKK